MKRILSAIMVILSTAQSFGTTQTVIVGSNFSPDSITITQGDTILFNLSGSHNALEVSQATWNIPGNTPLPGGFNTPFGVSTLTGLSVGVHYYVCSVHFGGLRGRIFVQAAPTPVVIPNVWINEIHYDNVGTDVDEGFEIAGTAGIDLGCFRVFLYNGLDSLVYSTQNLSGIIPNQDCGSGTVWFSLPANGMQNGNSTQNQPDGIVLEYAAQATGCGVNNADTILQFLSYEGTFAAAGGRANGLISTDIGVSENGTQAVGNSLQLGGIGTSYSQFAWQTSLASTHDSVNQNQFFCPPNPSVEFVITSSSVSEGIGTFQLALSILHPNSNPTSVDVNVLGGGTATPLTDYSFSPLTVTFPANSTFTQNVTVTVVDDIIAEGNESFTFQLNFPTNNATIGTNGQHVVTIIDNDTLRFDINPPSQSVNENAGIVTIPVSLSNISPNATNVTVHLETTGTTATQGADFYFNDTTLVWPAGSFGPILVPVTVIDDNLFEPNETVKLRLTNPTNGALFVNDTFLLTIQNNDTMPSGNCADLFFSEYIEGSSNNKALEIFNPTTSNVDLSQYKIFKSTNGGSSTGVFGLSGILAPDSVYIVGNTSSNVLITSQADTLSGFFNFTGNDAFALIHLTDTIDIIGQLGVDPGTGWVVDTGTTDNHTLIRSYYNYKGDTSWSAAASTWNVYRIDMFDSLGFHHIALCGTPQPVPPAYVHFILLSDTVSESAGVVRAVIQVDNPSSIPVNIFIARDDNAGTASAGVDYNFSNQSFITNNGGTTFDTVTITVLEDQLIEPTETVVLHFLNVSANTNVIQDSTFTLYIEDNDTLVASFLGAGFSYVEKDTMVEVKVFLSTFPADTILVNVTLAPGNTTAGSDFIFSDTVLVFLPNSTDTQSAWITIIDDNIVEPNEQINFNLTNTNGTRIGISAYTLTIIDNDSTVGISQIDLDKSITMFPNPVMNTLTIQTEKELLDLEVTDLLGNTLIPLGKLSAGRNSLDVSLLRDGMYFLNVRDEHQLFSRRFVKQD